LHDPREPWRELRAQRRAARLTEVSLQSFDFSIGYEKPTALAPFSKWRGDRLIKVTFFHFAFKAARGRSSPAITGVTLLAKLNSPGRALDLERRRTTRGNVRSDRRVLKINSGF
jgi:hypothetical protein